MLKQSSNKGPFWGPCSAKLRQRDLSAHLAKLRQRDMSARLAKLRQCDGRQCRCRSAFVLLAMIVVRIVAFDFEKSSISFDNFRDGTEWHRGGIR